MQCGGCTSLRSARRAARSRQMSRDDGGQIEGRRERLQSMKTRIATSVGNVKDLELMPQPELHPRVRSVKYAVERFGTDAPRHPSPRPLALPLRSTFPFSRSSSRIHIPMGALPFRREGGTDGRGGRMDERETDATIFEWSGSTSTSESERARAEMETRTRTGKG